MEKQDRIDQLVAENQELLALTKQAFVKREVEKESVSVDEEWEKFAAEHAEELEALEKDEPHAVGGDLQSPTREVRISNPFHLGILPYKVAASIIGILFTAGVAFAAIHIVRHFVGEDVKSPTQEVQIPNFQIRPNRPQHCRQILSRRTRQPTRSPLFSTMSHWIRCFPR